MAGGTNEKKGGSHLNNSVVQRKAKELGFFFRLTTRFSTIAIRDRDKDLGVKLYLLSSPEKSPFLTLFSRGVF